jgi:hypothetical protein
MTVKPYTKKHAEALIDAYGERRWNISEEGLSPKTEPIAWYRAHGLIEECKEQSWTPVKVFEGEDDAPDIAATPALPFPFDERDLAAFMLGGLGYFLAEFYGGLGDEIDEHALDRIDPAQNYARRAVRGAFAAYREAVERVGQPDRELAARMYEAHAAYRKARTDAMGRHSLSAVPQAMAGDSDERRRELNAEYQRRLALVEGEVSALGTEAKLLQDESESAEQTWLRAMVAELLKAATGPCETEAKPAPQPVPMVQSGAIDFEMLATPEQLIGAFGNFTGMCKAWFDNLTDTPRLLAARRVTGTGGKHYTPPLFCPFEVMQWLIDEKRKKGRKVSPEKAWHLLQSNFEKVYNTRSAGDPR